MQQSNAVDQTDATEYVGASLRGTMDDIAALINLAESEPDDLDLDELGADRLESLGIENQLGDIPRAVLEEADARLCELPLSVDRTVSFEIVLGTGGPDRRIVVECDALSNSAGEPAYGPDYEIRRVLYRYSWSGSAEVALVGEDREVAEAFARRVVPELVE